MRALKTTLLFAALASLTSCGVERSEVSDDTAGLKSETQKSGSRSDTKKSVRQSSRQRPRNGHLAHKSHQNHRAAGKQTAGGHRRHSPESKRNNHASGKHRNRQHGQHAQQPTANSDVSQGNRPRKARTERVENAEKDPLKIFKRRILPILQSNRSSSCTECHLSGVAIKDFILADQSKTFASLRQRGLIDVKNPDESKILKFIARKPDKPNPISEQVRQLELIAFRAWIRAAVKDPQLLKAAAGKDVVGLKLPPEVIRHARKDRVISSFVDNIWSQMGRCINCHSPDRNQRVVRKRGERVSWIVPRNPAATLKKLVDGGNIDLKNPEKSPVLLKPCGLMQHGGGPKFQVGGPTYRNFLTFLKDYAATVNGEYKSVKDLPAANAEVVYLTQQHLRIVGIPAAFAKVPLQVDIFRWDRRQKQWSKERWATAFNPINGKRRMWQSLISVTAPTGSSRAGEVRKNHTLPPGSYLAKIYIDRQGKTRKNPEYRLGKKEFVGQVEITGQWPNGYRPPKIIRLPERDRRSRR
ncbi:MAG: hypothetical protein IID45_11640 [Planctomycetes bacterium]|nr:hypothetical protein [Planctomycetota bacterium]